MSKPPNTSARRNAGKHKAEIPKHHFEYIPDPELESKQIDEIAIAWSNCSRRGIR
jgi:hypothetical protein